MTGTSEQPREGKTGPIASSMTAAQQAGFAVVAQSSKDDYEHGAPVHPSDLTPGDLAVFGDSTAIITGPGQLRWADGTPLSVDQAVTRADFKGFFRPSDPAPAFAAPQVVIDGPPDSRGGQDWPTVRITGAEEADSAYSAPVENASREKDSGSDMLDAISEIGGEMVDQLIDGIRDHCASTPNPLLAPERHFFRELGSGLVAMSHDDLLTLCAAAITRIAHPDLFAAH